MWRVRQRFSGGGHFFRGLVRSKASKSKNTRRRLRSTGVFLALLPLFSSFLVLPFQGTAYAALDESFVLNPNDTANGNRPTVTASGGGLAAPVILKPTTNANTSFYGLGRWREANQCRLNITVNLDSATATAGDGIVNYVQSSDQACTQGGARYTGRVTLGSPTPTAQNCNGAGQQFVNGECIQTPNGDGSFTGGGVNTQGCAGSDAPADTNCSTIPAGCPGSTQQGPKDPSVTCQYKAVSTSDSTQANNQEADICPITKRNAFRWFFCPFTEIAQQFTDGMDFFIEKYLSSPNAIFAEEDADGYNPGYKQAWETFRGFGIALVIIAAIVMVASEALNLNIVDAYTVRKVMPRLLVAAIGIAISWEFTKFLVGFFDALGHGASAIIYSAFTPNGASESTFAGSAGNFLVQWLAVIGAPAAAAGYFIAFGPLGVAALLAAIVLALLIGLIVLLARQAIIVACVIMAPLAIAAYILPNTNKLANFWWNSFMSMLLLYPIATGLIALCKSLGIIVSSATGPNSGGVMATISGMIIYFLGYALFPLAFRLSGGLMHAIFNLAGEKSNGVFGGLKKFRQNQAKSRIADMKSGKANFAGGKLGEAVIRRTTTKGGMTSMIPGLKNTAYGQMARSRYDAANQLHMSRAVDEALKADNNFAGGNDGANHLLKQQGITRNSFLSQRTADHIRGGMDQNSAKAEALRELNQAEAGYGARVGSELSRVAATKALRLSNKGYDWQPAKGEEFDPQAKYRNDTSRAFIDAAKLAHEGLITQTEAASMVRANKGRTGTAGISFGTVHSEIGNIMKNLDQKKADSELMSRGVKGTDTYVSQDKALDALAQGVVDGADPRELIGGRHEDVQALAPYMLTNVTKKLESGNEADTLDALADLDGLYNLMGQASPKKGKFMANGVMSQMVEDTMFGVPKKDKAGKTYYEVTGDKVTVSELLERARNYKPADITGSQRLIERSKQYVNRYQADAQAARDAAMRGEGEG